VFRYYIVNMSEFADGMAELWWVKVILNIACLVITSALLGCKIDHTDIAGPLSIVSTLLELMGLYLSVEFISDKPDDEELSPTKIFNVVKNCFHLTNVLYCTVASRSFADKNILIFFALVSGVNFMSTTNFGLSFAENGPGYESMFRVLMNTSGLAGACYNLSVNQQEKLLFRAAFGYSIAISLIDIFVSLLMNFIHSCRDGDDDQNLYSNMNKCFSVLNIVTHVVSVGLFAALIDTVRASNSFIFNLVINIFVMVFFVYVYYRDDKVVAKEDDKVVDQEEQAKAV
jgi:hypothetical protein